MEIRRPAATTPTSLAMQYADDVIYTSSDDDDDDSSLNMSSLNDDVIDFD